MTICLFQIMAKFAARTHLMKAAIWQHVSFYRINMQFCLPKNSVPFMLNSGLENPFQLPQKHSNFTTYIIKNILMKTGQIVGRYKLLYEYKPLVALLCFLNNWRTNAKRKKNWTLAKIFLCTKILDFKEDKERDTMFTNYSISAN